MRLGSWACPTTRRTNISYTILALINTNLIFPAFPGAEGAGAGALGGGGPVTGGGHGTNGTVYHVTTLADSGAGSLRDAVSSTNRTIVFDLSGTIALASPLVITNSYLTIAGQTAPGDGIAVAGNMTTVQSAHDVVIRYVRFRPGNTALNPAIWANDFEGNFDPSITTFNAGNYFAGGWHVDKGSVEVLGPSFGGAGGSAFKGSFYIDLDGHSAGEVSTNISTIPGVTYTLSFVYTSNPGDAPLLIMPQAQF